MKNKNSIDSILFLHKIIIIFISEVKKVQYMQKIMQQASIHSSVIR